jgi:hypothetical protein
MDLLLSTRCDRSEIRRPRSVGVRIHSDVADALIVVHTGGWADADYVRLDRDDGVHTEYPPVEEAATMRPLLHRVLTHLAGETDGGRR